MYRRPMNQSQGTTDDTPVGHGVNALSSLLLQLKELRVIIEESSVRAVGPRASAFVPAGTTADRSSTSSCLSAGASAKVEVSKCKAQMRIISFIQDEHSIEDLMMRPTTIVQLLTKKRSMFLAISHLFRLPPGQDDQVEPCTRRSHCRCISLILPKREEWVGDQLRRNSSPEYRSSH